MLICPHFVLANVVADVSSARGQIGFDINFDGTYEMQLNSSGLGIGTASIDSSLDISGSLGLRGQNVSSNLTLSNNSLVFADSRQGDITLTLPYAGNVEGRFYFIKKVSNLNTVFLDGGGPLIDDLTTISLDTDFGSYPSVELVSHGNQWYLMRQIQKEVSISSDNLIGYWPMDDSSGNLILDESGGGHDVTVIGMDESDLKVHGKFGRAIRLDGINDRLDPLSPDPGYFHDEFSASTVSLWCTVDPGGDGPRLIWKEGGATNGQGIAYRTGPDTIVYATVQNGTIVEIASTSTFTEDASNWIHVVIVYDKGAMKLYVNGVEEATSTNSTIIPYHSGVPSLGDIEDTSDSAFTNPKPWEGRIDEVRWFNKALSSIEIEALFNRGN